MSPTGYGSQYKTLATCEDKDELKIWWDLNGNGKMLIPTYGLQLLEKKKLLLLELNVNLIVSCCPVWIYLKKKVCIWNKANRFNKIISSVGVFVIELIYKSFFC